MKKSRRNKLLRRLLFTLAGAGAGVAWHLLVGCSDGSCARFSSPVSSALYLGLMGYLISWLLEGGCCCGGEDGGCSMR